jgi:23S rRNA (uracil1939-C5)-methyltransferase
VAAVLGGEALGSPLFGYRNKMDFTFGSKRWVEAALDPEAGDETSVERPRDFALGLHAPGRHDKVLDVTTCQIAFASGREVLTAARELALELDLAPWDLLGHTGLLRHLVLREGARTGELLVYLVTSSQAGVERVPDYAARLVERCPGITTLVHGVRDAISSVAEGETDVVLHGPGHIREELGGVTFEVSARSFFQTNTAAAEGLFRVVAEEACVTSDEVVFDLYCGAGSIALLVAGAAREVWGFERVVPAVEDARRNAAAAGITNAHFVPGDVLLTASAAGLAELGAPSADVVIVDPPRAGLHPGVVSFLVERAAEGSGARLVYVSCNPKAAAVDLEALVAGGYRVLRARPVDLFPHTPHLECVFTLEYGGPPATEESDG